MMRPSCTICPLPWISRRWRSSSCWKRAPSPSRPAASWTSCSSSVTSETNRSVGADLERLRRHRSRTPLEDLRGERSEEHTSELQSRLHLVCRLLLEKKKKNNIKEIYELQESYDKCNCNQRGI